MHLDEPLWHRVYTSVNERNQTVARARLGSTKPKMMPAYTTFFLPSCRTRQKNLELAGLVQDSVPELLLGDPGRIRQVLINLVGNAVKVSRHP